MAKINWHEVVRNIDYSPPPMTYCDTCCGVAKDSPYWSEAGCRCDED